MKKSRFYPLVALLSAVVAIQGHFVLALTIGILGLVYINVQVEYEDDPPQEPEMDPESYRRTTTLLVDAIAQAELEQLRTALAQMNAIVNHQTDRPIRDMTTNEICSTEPAWRYRRHPLTCGNDSNHVPLYPYWNGKKVVLVCRDCDYTQDNSGPFGR